MSSPSLKSTAKYTSFPVIWVSISFINDPRFLLIFSHNCASNLWWMKFFMKRKQYYSSTGEKRKGMKSYLGINRSTSCLLYHQVQILWHTNTYKTENANANTVRHKYKIGRERNVEMKSYLGLSHSPPGLLSNTFCRRRWWEREMTNVKEDEGRAIDIYKYPQNFNHSLSFTTEYGCKTNKISNITIVRKINDKCERRRRQDRICINLTNININISIGWWAIN